MSKFLNSEKLNLIITQDAQKLIFNSKFFRNGIQSLSALALAFSISSCGEKPKENYRIQVDNKESTEQVNYREEYENCVSRLKILKPKLDEAWNKQDLNLHSELLKEYQSLEKERKDIYYYKLNAR
jgi:hypothetical protein